MGVFSKYFELFSYKMNSEKNGGVAFNLFIWAVTDTGDSSFVLDAITIDMYFSSKKKSV